MKCENALLVQVREHTGLHFSLSLATILPKAQVLRLLWASMNFAIMLLPFGFHDCIDYWGHADNSNCSSAHRLFYQLGDSARGSLQVVAGESECVGTIRYFCESESTLSKHKSKYLAPCPSHSYAFALNNSIFCMTNSRTCCRRTGFLQELQQWRNKQVMEPTFDVKGSSGMSLN